MKCVNHLEKDAVAICNYCGRSICSECFVEIKGEAYCKDCLVAKTGQVKKEERSPALAAVLSFIIAGLGQIYNGQIGKGLLIFFTCWLIIPWIIGIFDAYNTAKKINAGQIIVKSRPGCLIAFIISVVVFTVGVFFIALLAAIAIPNLLRARMNANEAVAAATVKNISTAIESYRTANNGQYPPGEYKLKQANPPYLTDTYNNMTIQGYVYSLNLSPSGYNIIAKPVNCEVTGNKIFTAETEGKFSERNCK